MDEDTIEQKIVQYLKRPHERKRRECIWWSRLRLKARQIDENCYSQKLPPPKDPIHTDTFPIAQKQEQDVSQKGEKRSKLVIDLFAKEQRPNKRFKIGLTMRSSLTKVVNLTTSAIRSKKQKT